MSEAAPTVRVAQGELRGKADRGVFAFLGIPYAAAPFGSRRMLPPQPPPSWEGVRDATQYGPTCPREDYPEGYRQFFREVFIPGEECLNLNVWTPDPAASLPVLVWIHGGAFLNGSGSVAEYRGTAFARDGVVCVTINYRLGAEGYLYTGADGGANCGVLDQVAALRWVQENIAALGGDPARVTVAGESAGAMSVTTLLAVPQARGLFARAITESGAAAHTIPAETGALVASRLAAALGVPPERAALAALPPAAVAAAAAALSQEVGSGADLATWGELTLSLLPFCPVIDGEVLPQPPLDALRAGAAADVPLLTGTNLDETRLFLGATGAIDLIDDALLAGAAIGYGASPQTVAAYQAARPGAGPGDILAALVTDWFFRIPAIRVAEAHAQTWMYRFDWPTTALAGRLGSCHAAEIPFVFDTLDEPGVRGLLGDSAPQAAADTVHGIWVRFVTAGDPGWPRYDPVTRTTALLTEKTEVAADPAGDERARWDARQPA
jgi:para-nitrobenzyl esterase